MNYRKTLIACYLGFVTQAITANFAPLLFLTFHNVYNIPLGKIALISSVFFITQLIVDILCAKFADRIGYRRCVVGSQLFSAAGLLGLAFLPQIMPDPFMGIIISTIVGVILLSTVFFSVFGIGNWKWLACIWAIIPLYNMFNFITCPIEHPAEDGQGMSIGNLLKTPVFIISILLMICAGASELSMAQWASAFAESALDLSKAMGDIAGPCLFAVTMGISRSLYGKYGDRLDLIKFMIGSGMLCLICYLVASLSDIPMLGLAGCIICGFSVGIMWPGTISICSGKMPSGGTAMFALLAMAGDLGGAIGPGIVGNISQSAGDDIRKGVLAGCIFPLVLVILTFVISKNVNKNRQE